MTDEQTQPKDNTVEEKNPSELKTGTMDLDRGE